MAPFANNTNTSLDYIALTSALGSWLQPALYIVLGAAGVYVLRLVRKASGSPEPPSIDAQILKVLWDQLKEQKAQTAAIERIEERLDGLEGRLVATTPDETVNTYWQWGGPLPELVRLRREEDQLSHASGEARASSTV